MKRGLWKWWLLGVLAVAMGYVWYNAFQTMYPETTGFRVTTPQSTQSSRRGNTETLQYQSPKVNPFKRPTATPAQPSQPVTRQRPAEAVAPLSPQFELTGILRQDRQPQAVIARQDSSQVITLGDSLGSWELLRITSNAAVFGHGKNRDTLWLYSDD